MIRTLVRGALLTLGTVVALSLFASSPALSCDCTNCSAEHCQGGTTIKPGHPDFLWNPRRLSDRRAGGGEAATPPVNGPATKKEKKALTDRDSRAKAAPSGSTMPLPGVDTQYPDVVVPPISEKPRKPETDCGTGVITCD
jgi:hypothetical protein